MGKKNMPSIARYLAQYKGVIFSYIFLSVLVGVADVFVSIWSANAIAEITNDDYRMALYIWLFVIGLTILQRFCLWALNFIYSKYSNEIMAKMNFDLARQAFKLNSSTYNTHGTGTFVMRIVEDPARVVDGLASIVDCSIGIITFCVVLIYVATLNIWLSAIIVLLAIISLSIEYIRIKKLRGNRAEMRGEYDSVNSMTTEIVRSEKDIKSLGLEQELDNLAENRFQSYRKSRYKMDLVDANLRSLRNFILIVGMLCCILLGIFLMDIGPLSIVTFMIVYSNRDSLFYLVNNLGTISNSIVNINVSKARMRALFDEEEFITEKFGNKDIENVVGEIEFKNVSFSFKEYEYSQDNNKAAGRELVNENKIFDNLSFKIKPNSTVAFVGKSGSGKSTILNLISKMYECDDGQVLIDGIDIKQLSKRTLRKSISLVNQFPYIFDMSIKNNLLLAKGDATEQEIDDAIKKSSLDEFVNTLPKGVDTCVGESGIKLSGGQKQRLAIARAFLRNSAIVLFDESTSSLDNFAQDDVKKSIGELKGKSTIVIVAHRLSTIKDVDHIFFLDNGAIVDEGTFDQLFKRNKTFKAMFLAEDIYDEEIKKAD